MSSLLSELQKKYQPLGKLHGNILLLNTNDALRFADDLEAIDMGVGGLELWYTLNYDGQEVIVEDPNAPDYFDLLKEKDGIHKSVITAKQWILHEKPERIKYISFILDTDEPYWEIYKQNPTVDVAKSTAHK